MVFLNTFLKSLCISLIVFAIFESTLFAHPGRKAGDGCHYCRTNCSSWGEVANARHCHGVSEPAYIPPVRTTPSCSLNAYYNSSTRSCECNTGYTKHGSRCVLVPLNAYATPYSTTDAWLCNDGYEESGNACIEIVEEIIEVFTEPLNANTGNTPVVTSSLLNTTEESIGTSFLVTSEEIIADTPVTSSDTVEIFNEPPESPKKVEESVTPNLSSSYTSSTSSESGGGIFSTLFWLLAGGWGYKVYRDRKDKKMMVSNKEEEKYYL